MKVQHPGTVTRSCRRLEPERHASPTSRPSTAWRSAGPPPGRMPAPTASTTAPPGPRCSPSTPRRRRSRDRSTWDPCSATCRPTRSPATAACGDGSSSTRWAGTTTGCPPSAGCRTSSECVCDPSLPYDPDFRLPEEPGKDDIPVSRPNFIALCHELTAEDEQAFEDLWRRVGLSVDWGRTYATIDDRSRRDQPAHVPAQPRPRRGLLRGGAHACGTSTSRRRWRRPRWRTANGTAPTTGIRFDDIEIETTRPELIAACVALVAHPDDERYRDRFGTTVHTPALRCRGARARPPPGRAGQGHRASP